MIRSYIEEAVVPGHNMGFNANGVIIQEGCSVDYERIIPIDSKDYAEMTEGALNTDY